MMFWLLLTLLVVVAGMLALRRKGEYASTEREPWRASLDDDEELDMDEIRRAEEEWLESEAWQDEPEDEGWR